MNKISALLALSVVLIFAPDASASATYTIKKGDTLHKIAIRHKVTVRDIESLNRVKASNLKPGSKIQIPGENVSPREANIKHRKDEPATVQPTEPASQHSKAEIAQSAKPANQEKTEREIIQPVITAADRSTYHVVKKGDTLRAIARKHQVSEADIRNLNDMRSAKIRPGRKLLVKVSGPMTYTVRKGDTLRQIAKKFNMAIDDLMEINEMTSPEVKAGQKLYLDERPEVVNLDQKYIVMAKSIEDELHRVPESAEFAQKTAQDKLVTFAKKLLNIPYKFGGNTILGIDCSSYVKKVYGLMGINLPRTAREQFREGELIARHELSVGDLVFFRTYASFPSHVGIYLGNDLFIHASSKGRKVTINSLETPYYVKRYIGAKRLISPAEKQAETDPAS